MKNKRRLKIQHWKLIAAGLMLYDAAAIAFFYFLGLWLRFDFQYSMISGEYLHSYAQFIPVYMVLSICFFWYMRMYRGIWRFAEFNELIRYASSSLIASVVHAVVITVWFGRMPFSYYIVGMVMQLLLVVGIRFSYRFYTQVMVKKTPESEVSPAKNVMIIGVGAAGRTVARELQQSDKINQTPSCIIDDNPNKWGRYVEGIPVAGGRDGIVGNAEKY